MTESRARSTVGEYAAACRDRSHRPSWWVRQYRSNRSAFNGYRYTPSDWSEVVCAIDGMRWRTKAAYVDGLPRQPHPYAQAVRVNSPPRDTTDAGPAPSRAPGKGSEPS